MSAPLVVPFNFQPSSVSVQTGAYTIPSGYYAFITANVTPTGSFTISGSTALSGFQASTSQTTLSSSGLRGINGGAGSINPSLGVIDAPNTGSGHSDAGAAFGFSSVSFTDSSVATASYWVPTGTVLGVSSGRYVVSLYANIT